ncbi:MAG: hypothetical protein ACKOCH_23465, partial [Bacteroidota bacterium]
MFFAKYGANSFSFFLQYFRCPLKITQLKPYSCAFSVGFGGAFVVILSNFDWYPLGKLLRYIFIYRQRYVVLPGFQVTL